MNQHHLSRINMAASHTPYLLLTLKNDPSNITNHITSFRLNLNFAYAHMVTKTASLGELKFSCPRELPRKTIVLSSGISGSCSAQGFINSYLNIYVLSNIQDVKRLFYLKIASAITMDMHNGFFPCKIITCTGYYVQWTK
jgi:hypothetical protein